MKAYLTLFTIFTLGVFGQDVTETLCSSQQSCGQCIKAHSECAWCIDPHSILTNRCQWKSKFTNETCSPHLIYSPQTAQIKIQQNLPLQSFHHDGKTLVRLQPQATSVRLMPGNSATVSFKYLHQSDPQRKSSEPDQMIIQTSEIKDTPLKLKYFIDCDGETRETKSCQVKDNQIVEFKIELFVSTCSSAGDITLSVGVQGQRTIAGLYVNTICGCECEKHPEMNSILCHQNGHLVCGQCVCDKSRGGDKCECPLAMYDVTTAEMLEDKCRFNSSTSVCSSSGKCKCGQCQCDKPTISGKFCQCDNDSCPLASNGKICSGNGVCDCGICKCEMDWDRNDCSCSLSTNNCIENGEMCSNNGRCECNRCVCDTNRTGAFCGSEEQTSQQPVPKMEESEEESAKDPVTTDVTTVGHTDNRSADTFIVNNDTSFSSERTNYCFITAAILISILNF
uniref:I-EGF_1 domain-containing protein n=1 Tax=Caenorhabditis japonica TaxID=281687 RepID=A0A8R1DH14_CAEJA